VSKYEVGERKLDYVEVNEICEALGISIQRFNRLYEKKIAEGPERVRSARRQARRH
jgi:hypothetical protein